jgi:arylsulfatase A-like enzyme
MNAVTSSPTTVANPTPTSWQAPVEPNRVTTILTLSAWFAIVTGFVEAAGLELFQRINWANWGHTAHVSPEIFWVAPLWDLALFLPLALTLILFGYLVPKLPVARVIVFLLALLMFYDWLALPERLVHRSALILAAGLATVVVRAFGKHETRFLNLAGASLPWLAAAVVLGWAGIQGGERLREEIALKRLPTPPPKALNVAVIVLDTLRADHLSAQGYTRITTPNIDHLAQQGVLFENAISASSWTLPSHASLLSGRYSYEHGATDVKQGATAFDDRYPTLPEVLAQHGYRTAAFSGNYLYFSGNLGFKRGFIRFEDYFHSTFDGFTRTLYGREIGRLVFKREKIRRLIIRLGFPSIDELQPLGSSSWMLRKRASEVNREALNWIDRDSQRPFFVFMNYFDVHRPYTTPPGYPRKFVHLDTHGLWLDQIDSPTTEGRTNAYDECVGYTDDQIQYFFDQLKQRGLSENTLVVVTSDHGDLLGEHGLYSHRNSLYRPLIQVPLIFWAPGRLPARTRIATPVSNISVAKTITDLLGLKELDVFPGQSLSSLWAAKPVQSWPHPLSELARFKDESVRNPSRYGAMNSLVTPQLHYMFHEKFGTELFDWAHDPEEKTSLTKTPQGHDAAVALAEEVHDRLAHPQ